MLGYRGPMPPVPADFGARLRAGRAYADDISRPNFAEKLNLAGAGHSTLRDWERGKGSPSQLVAESLIPRLAEATGLPEDFYWGVSSDGPGVAERLGEIEDLLSALVVQTEARDLEVLRRLDALLLPNAGFPPPPRP